jgi:hypothetical protein
VQPMKKRDLDAEESGQTLRMFLRFAIVMALFGSLAALFVRLKT